MITLESCEGLLRAKAMEAYKELNTRHSIPYDDCLGEAYLIFCKAVEKYDPNRGASFQTHLYWKLRNLRRRILLSNGVSHLVSSGEVQVHELPFDIPDEPHRIATEELSPDGGLVVSLLLRRVIGREYGTGKGRKAPGKKTIKQYMKQHMEWSYKRTEKALDEITDWWRE